MSKWMMWGVAGAAAMAASLGVIALGTESSAVHAEQPPIESAPRGIAKHVEKLTEAVATTLTGKVAPKTHFAAPTLSEWRPEPQVNEPEMPTSGDAAFAYHFEAQVRSSTRRDAKIKGVVRRNTWLPLEGRLGSRGCERGSWFKTPGGVVCREDGFWISSKRKHEKPQKPPALNEPLPFEYALVKEKGTPRYYRLPTPEEHAEVMAKSADESQPDYVEERMVGDFFVAIDRELESGEEAFVRTVRGRYVPKSALEPQVTPGLIGQHITSAEQLPLAIVHSEARSVLTRDGSELRPTGVAEKYGRFKVLGEQSFDGAEYVKSAHGFIKRDEVRIARAIPRPEGISAAQKWIHVDLSEQTLVAYEGDKPVFATLIASGKPGHDTPTGMYRISQKYVSTTMRGDDPIDGLYDVEDVPWTMYYHEGYALHGAYWHDTFGNVRSHGCTNIAPADARWLFYWTSPELPERWHGVRLKRGTHVYFTRDKGSEG